MENPNLKNRWWLGVARWIGNLHMASLMGLSRTFTASKSGGNFHRFWRPSFCSDADSIMWLPHTQKLVIFWVLVHGSKPRHWMWLKFLSWLFETSLLESETRVLEAQLGMLLVSWVWTSVGYPNSRCFLYWKLGVFQDMFVHGVRFGKLQLHLHPSNSKKHNAKPGFITIFPESLDYHDDWW